MKVLFLTNIPSPYRVDFFNEWGKYCDLTVIFEKKHSNGRDTSWKNYNFINFKGLFINKEDKKGCLCKSIVDHLRKNKYDKIILTNISSKEGIKALIWMKIKKISYCIRNSNITSF